MDYQIDVIIIVFVLCCIFFLFLVGSSQHGSKNFPTPKNDSKKKEADEYQRYAEEELEKNTKQMESFKGEDAEVISDSKKIGLKSRNLEQIRRMSVDKKPKRPM